MKNGNFRVIVLLGIVSLFADVTYEGARSITGPYLLLLGASATAVGFVSGLGELVGFAFRFVSGYLADRTGRYWGMTILGYIVNLFSIPLLGLTYKWEIASSLIVVERLGKAIRNPSRDTILSSCVRSEKRGLGFGIHEALDQIGAILGPLICAAIIYLSGNYRKTFLSLSVPALFAIFFLFLARRTSEERKLREGMDQFQVSFKLDRRFLLYLLGMCFVGAGFCDFALIAFHFRRISLLSEASIPIFYAFAMAIDGLSAPILGRLYDRFGIRIILFTTFITALSSIFVFYGGSHSALFGMVLWGVGMATQESIVRAHVANITPEYGRGKAFGIFNGAFGVSWFLGSAFLGSLYERSVLFVVLFSTGIQLLSLPFIYFAGSTRKD